MTMESHNIANWRVIAPFLSHQEVTKCHQNPNLDFPLESHAHRTYLRIFDRVFEAFFSASEGALFSCSTLVFVSLFLAKGANRYIAFSAKFIEAFSLFISLHPSILVGTTTTVLSLFDALSSLSASVSTLVLVTSSLARIETLLSL